MNKDACVIALTHLNDKKVLFKNRDRNYTPNFKICHVIADNGTEVLYFQDSISGWVEGINEYGICITNAALAVNHDEKEGKKRLPGDRNRFSKDAWRFLEALKCKSLLEAVDRMTNYRNGVRGHTIVTDQKNTFVIEMTSQHQAKVEEIVDRNFVRTNHGARHPDAGYTHGEALESSKQRQEKTYTVLNSSLRSPMDMIRKLYQQRSPNIDNPFNVVRKIDMFTSNQILFEPSKKKLTVITIDEDAIYEGYEKHFKGSAKCKISIKKIHLNKEGKAVLENVDLNPLEVKLMAPNENTLRLFAYGSLMYEPLFPKDICNERKAFVNGISRNLNMESESRGHLVFGTLPYGRMEGTLYEYPIEKSEKILKALDKREGFNEASTSMYLRRGETAFTKENPEGLSCLVYITNEESRRYQGLFETHDLVDSLLTNPDFDEYFYGVSIALDAINGQDRYIDKIKEVHWPMKKDQLQNSEEK
jgi:cation transport regulator ChaC